MSDPHDTYRDFEYAQLFFCTGMDGELGPLQTGAKAIWMAHILMVVVVAGF